MTSYFRVSNIALIICWTLLYLPTTISAQQTKKLPRQAYQAPQKVVPARAGLYGLRRHPASSFRLYAATTRGLQVTENGGLTWIAVPIDGSDQKVFSVAVHPSKPEELYAGRRDGLWKSEDDGLTWSPLRIPDSIPLSIAIAQSRPDTLYVGTARSGVFKSTNRGNQWVQISGGLPVARAGGRPDEVRTLAVDPTDSNLVYAAFPQIGIYRTTNGGKSWHEFDKGIRMARPISPPQLAFDRKDPRRLYLAFSERMHSHLITTRVFLLSDSGWWVPLRVRLPDNLIPLALLVDGSMNMAQLWGADGVWEVPLSGRKK